MRCKSSNEYPSIISGAGDNSYYVFFEGEEVARIYDGVVAKVGKLLDVWRRQKGGSYEKMGANDRTLYTNKKKALDHIVSASAPIADAKHNNQELISATKVIKEFENQRIEDKEVRPINGESFNEVNKRFNQ